MQLVVRTQRATEWLDGRCEYRTTEDGELDVFDQEQVVVETYAKGYWQKVSRVKDDDEEWPDSLRRNAFEPDYESQEAEPNLGLAKRISTYETAPATPVMG